MSEIVKLGENIQALIKIGDRLDQAAPAAGLKEWLVVNGELVGDLDRRQREIFYHTWKIDSGLGAKREISGGIRNASEIRSAVKIITHSFQPDLNVWPEEDIDHILHDNQRERLIGWKQALEWVLKRRTLGREEVNRFLEGDTPSGLPVNLEAWPEDSQDAAFEDWYRICLATGEIHIDWIEKEE